jgi:hypothetical protein
MDTDFVDCNTVIYTFPFASGERGTTDFTFDNVHFVGNIYFMLFTNGENLVYDVTQDTIINFATLGDVQDGGTFDGFYTVNVPTRQVNLTDHAHTAWTYDQSAYFRRAQAFNNTFTNSCSSQIENRPITMLVRTTL